MRLDFTTEEDARAKYDLINDPSFQLPAPPIYPIRARAADGVLVDCGNRRRRVKDSGPRAARWEARMRGFPGQECMDPPLDRYKTPFHRCNGVTDRHGRMDAVVGVGVAFIAAYFTF